MGAVLILLVGALGCAGKIQAGSGGTPYPDAVRWDFSASCQKSAQMTMGYLGSQKYCACLIDEFQARFSLEDFRALSQGIRGGALPQPMLEVVTFCRSKPKKQPD